MEQNLGGNLGSLSVCQVPPITTVRDAVANLSAKTWTVPAGEMWKLNWVHVSLDTSADVGNRQLSVDILDAANDLLLDMTSAVVQAASTSRHYQFLQGIYRETAFTNDELEIPMPADLFLQAGQKIRVWDEAAIAPAADDMTVVFQYQRFKMGA